MQSQSTRHIFLFDQVELFDYCNWTFDNMFILYFGRRGEEFWFTNADNWSYSTNADIWNHIGSVIAIPWFLQGLLFPSQENDNPGP